MPCKNEAPYRLTALGKRAAAALIVDTATLSYLAQVSQPQSLRAISRATKLPQLYTRHSLARLQLAGLVQRVVQ